MKGVENECVKLRTPSNVPKHGRMVERSVEGVERVQGVKNMSRGSKHVSGVGNECRELKTNVWKLKMPKTARERSRARAEDVE